MSTSQLHIMFYCIVEMLAASLRFSICKIGVQSSQSDGISFTQWHSCGVQLTQASDFS